MKIITSGLSYLDIDAYACSIAYAELLNLQGEEAVAVSTATLNESIPKIVRSWGAPLLTTHNPSNDDEFVIVDVSEPEFLDRIVEVDRVIEVIDHHVGYEAFWQQRIGDKADIEFVGAACTQIYERWVEAGLFDKMSQLSARLLVCGILDNTLNFGAVITTQRDVDAHQALLAKAELPAEWTAIYFTDCEKDITDDPVGSLKNDTKSVSFKSHPVELKFGQLVVWDGKKLLDNSKIELAKTMATLSPNWMINLISVSEKKNYLISDQQETREWLSNLLNVEFDDSVAITDRLWLRKEIIKQDLDS